MGQHPVALSLKDHQSEGQGAPQAGGLHDFRYRRVTLNSWQAAAAACRSASIFLLP